MEVQCKMNFWSWYQGGDSLQSATYLLAAGEALTSCSDIPLITRS